MHTKQIIIDVREPDEFQQGHVKGALNIPPADLMSGAKQLNDVAKDTPLIVYCRTGSRSNVAKNILTGYGYTNITNGVNQGQVESRYL